MQHKNIPQACNTDLPNQMCPIWQCRECLQQLQNPVAVYFMSIAIAWYYT